MTADKEDGLPLEVERGGIRFVHPLPVVIRWRCLWCDDRWRGRHEVTSLWESFRTPCPKCGSKMTVTEYE